MAIDQRQIQKEFFLKAAPAETLSHCACRLQALGKWNVFESVGVEIEGQKIPLSSDDISSHSTLSLACLMHSKLVKAKFGLS